VCATHRAVVIEDRGSGSPRISLPEFAIPRTATDALAEAEHGAEEAESDSTSPRASRRPATDWRALIIRTLPIEYGDGGVWVRVRDRLQLLAKRVVCTNRTCLPRVNQPVGIVRDHTAGFLAMRQAIQVEQRARVRMQHRAIRPVAAKLVQVCL